MHKTEKKVVPLLQKEGETTSESLSLPHKHFEDINLRIELNETLEMMHVC